MNATFARLVNERNLEALLELYEPSAVVRIDAEHTFQGTTEIETALRDLLKVPGTMNAVNHFCLEQGDIALLRADYAMAGEDGSRLLVGSPAEIVRRGEDGGWRYVIDHAAGSSLPPQI
ncbi:MAG: nuclear transport factor 2 family protein [Chloroflexota bacterium]|nr:nuclear transport factor 2 family protein [Chloroflexota bacterium]